MRKEAETQAWWGGCGGMWGRGWAVAPGPSGSWLGAQGPFPSGHRSPPPSRLCCALEAVTPAWCTSQTRPPCKREAKDSLRSTDRGAGGIGGGKQGWMIGFG